MNLRSVLMKTDNKKIAFEIVLIPLCILYLYYVLLYNHPKISTVLLYLTITITCVSFITKYIKEVYIYENKHNILKIIFTIVSILLLIVMVLNHYLKYKVLKYLFIIFVVLLLIYLLVYSVINIIKIIKSKDNLFEKTINSFFPSIAFYIILMGLIIYLK